MKNKAAPNQTDELNELLKESFLEMDFEFNNNQHFIDMIAATYTQQNSSINWKSQLKKHKISLYSISAIIGILSFIGLSTDYSNTPNYQPQQIQFTSWLANDSTDMNERITQVEKNDVALLDKVGTPYFKQTINKQPHLEKKILLPKANQFYGEIDTFRMPTLTEYEKDFLENIKPSMLKGIYKLNKRIYSLIPAGEFESEGTLIPVNSFYLRTREVSNMDYKLFLFDLIKNRRESDYKIAAPINTKWRKYGEPNEPFVHYYFSHQAYSNYPVVNITREAAELYCTWLTEEYEKAYADARKSRVINFYLPSDIEWMYAASGGGKNFPYPWGGPYVKNSSGNFLANFHPQDGNRGADRAENIAPGGTYNPNDFGLLNMSGNVAEMIYYHGTKEIGTKGGSWRSIAEDIKIKADDPFRGFRDADPEIGFRVAFTYLSE